MIIQHNMRAENGSRQFGITTKEKEKYSTQLSTGYKINGAADNAAGLMISEDMRAQVRSLQKASKNCVDGISLFQTADGAMQEAQNVIHRMRELCVQGANDVNVTADRIAIQTELELLKDEIDRMYEDVEFNTIKLFQNATEIPDRENTHLQIGSNAEQGIAFALPKIDCETLTIDEVCVKDYESASDSIDRCDYALIYINRERAVMGAMENRTEHAKATAENNAENLQISESKIRYTNMADSMVKLSKNQILSDAGTSMLSQANNMSQGVMTLLK